MGMCVKSQSSTADAGAALSEPEGNSRLSGSSDSLWEASLEDVSGIADAPPSLSVAIQVSRSMIHQEVNTEPYEPFETQQGDLSQKEKECLLLREQLKVACEDCEHTELRSSQETRDLEEKLQRHTEENKVNLPELP